jgi:ubiquinone/menaquinone biosynthesis C-methylase UbiE
MEFDPLAFAGTAEYYSRGRPPYSRNIAEVMRRELSLDGNGQLLDVGCGPGVLELALAALFQRVIALDPEVGMLTEGARRSRHAGVDNVRWIQGVAEDIPVLEVAPCRAVTFGQSFHRVRRREVAELVFDVLEPGGSLVLISNAVVRRPQPESPGYPVIPHDAIEELIITYLGEGTRNYLERWKVEPPERFEVALSQSSFRGSRTVHAPGRPDLIRDIDAVVDNYFSMSYAAPRLFGDRRDAYEADLRRLLHEHSPAGLFWDWPGDTELVIATKPGS